MLSEQNLHPLLFQIEPYPEIGTPVPALVDIQTNQPVFGRSSSRQLRFFSFLPRWVDVNVTGELMELWFRLDPRLQLTDITDRVNVPADQKIPNPNAFNMRRNRFRTLISVPVSAQGIASRPTRGAVEAIGIMTREQILLNTVMMIDFPNGRLLKPIIRFDKITGYVDSGLPMDHYISGFPGVIPVPSHRHSVVLSLRRRLQELACLKGLGNLATNYLQLADVDLPSWWSGAGPRLITEIDGLTHDSFVDGVLGYQPVVGAALAPVGAARPSRRPGARGGVGSGGVGRARRQGE